MDPRVSVIIPMYNNEHYLRECLDSVAGQTLQDIEVICVNDGSTDGTLGILEAYAQRDPRVRIIDKPNSGYGASMNQGIEAARGEYIGIVESDDLIKLDMYASLIAVADEHPGIDIVRGDHARFWGDGEDRRFEEVRTSSKQAYYDHVFCPCEDPGALRMRVLNQTGIYRRAFLEQHRIRFNESPGASYQDNGFFFLCFSLAASAKLIRGAFYLLRRDNEASSVHSAAKVYCMCDEYDHIRAQLLERGVPHPFLVMCAVVRYGNYYWTEHRVAHRYKRAFCQRFSEDFRFLTEAGEVDRFWFNKYQWRDLQGVRDNADLYYFTHWVDCDRFRADRFEAEVGHIRSSSSWRLGQAMTAPVRAAKRLLKRGVSDENASDPGGTVLERARLDDADSLADLVDWFWAETGYVYDDADPRTFNQKTIWLKLHGGSVEPHQESCSAEPGAPTYRVCCFHGKPEIVWVEQRANTGLTRDVYDTDWKMLPISVTHPNSDAALPRPELLDKMLDEAARISEGTPFLCVDVCATTARCVGATVTPDDGACIWDPPEYDLAYGEKLSLDGAQDAL